MTYIIELPDNQYLGTQGPVDNIKYAEEFDSESDTQDRADGYNADNGRGGKILARVRTHSI